MKSSSRFEPQSALITGLLMVLVFLIAFIPFSGAMDNDFVNWDDHVLIYENPVIKSLKPENLKKMFSDYSVAAGIWAPLTSLSHALDYHFHKLDPKGHHLTSVILHALNAVLVFLLFLSLVKRQVSTRDITREYWVAAVLASLVFAIHPLRVESVAWISERKDLLCGLFFLASLLSYVQYTNCNSAFHRRVWYLFALLLFILALASKPMAVTLPVVLLILDWYPLRRWTGHEATRKLVLEKLPYFAFSMAIAVMTVIAQKDHEYVSTFEDVTFLERIINSVHSLAFYIKNTVLPFGLVPFYPYQKNPGVLNGEVIASVVFLMGVTSLCLWLIRKGSRLGMATWLFYLVTISPVIGIIQVGQQAAADRYTYLPTLGISFLAGGAIIRVWQKGGPLYLKNVYKTCALFCSLGLLGVLAVKTADQVKVWKNGETLWKEVIRVFPGKVLQAHSNLATYYLENKKFVEAEREYLTALKIDPGNKIILFNLGLTYLKLNRLKEAQERFEIAKRIDPENAKLRVTLGSVYWQTGQLTKAEHEFKAALILDPGNTRVRNNLGLTYYQLGKPDEAKAEFLKILEKHPNHVEAHNNLGAVYFQLNQWTEARREYSTALKIDPSYQDARFNLENILYETEKIRNDMVLIKEGPFPMGFRIDNDREWGDTDEEPVHEVHLSTYWIDRFEVTAGEFSDFLNEHSEEAGRYIETGPAVTVVVENDRYRPRPGLDRYPANRVSWFGADAFCRWKGRRLPTEAEWEKAARGTDERIFPWGNQFPDNDRVTFRRKFSEAGFEVMEPVDGMKAGRSPYGLHHMAGNVWEWVADWYDSDYYQTGPAHNPKGPETGTSKVLRGGNWYYKAYYMRTTYRFNEKPETFKTWQGFRCAADYSAGKPE